MQVKELITFYVNEASKTLDVTFRLETDSDEEIRNDSIPIDEVETYGYEFLKEETKNFEDDNEDYNSDFGDDFDIFIDEEEVTSFLNEYYMINQKKLPPSELF